MQQQFVGRLVPYSAWIEQAINQGATLYVKRARLRHHGDLPLDLLEYLYGFEPVIVWYLLKPRWSHPLTAAGGLRRMLDSGVDEIAVTIHIGGGQSLGPGRIVEPVERLLRHANDRHVTEQVQAAYAALRSYQGWTPSRWEG